MLVMPKAEYVTWGGQRFDGSGVKPDIQIFWSPGQRPETDSQVERAVDILRQGQRLQAPADISRAEAGQRLNSNLI